MKEVDIEKKKEYRKKLVKIEIVLLLFAAVLIELRIFESDTCDPVAGAFCAFDHLGTNLLLCVYAFFALPAFIGIWIYITTTFKKPYNIALLILTLVLIGIGCGIFLYFIYK